MQTPMNGLNVVCALLVLGALSACGSSKQSTETEFDKAPWETVVVAQGDTVVVSGDAAPTPTSNTPAPSPDQPTPNIPSTTVPVAGATSAETAGVSSGSARTTPPDPRNFTPGWRVQVFASSNLQLADDKAAEFRTTSPHPVYVEYEPPFYKVRVGDFMTRQEADRFKDETARMGWQGAWVTETLVLRPGSGQ